MKRELELRGIGCHSIQTHLEPSIQWEISMLHGLLLLIDFIWGVFSHISNMKYFADLNVLLLKVRIQLY